MATGGREIERELRAAGEMSDADLDIAHLALMLAASDRPEISLAPYRTHLSELVDAARGTAADDISALSCSVAAGMLAGVMAGRFRYLGDAETYDDPRNANLAHVIDRRKGLPVTLGILYLHVGAKLGLDITGLNFPGHFVLRLRGPDEALVLDPFNGGQPLTPADLLALLRGVEGPEARLTPEACEAVGTRDILLRLENNILSRAIRAGDFARAREVVTRMIWLAPQRAGLRFELGRLEVHAGHMGAAADAFATCMDIASDIGEMRIAGMAEEALRRLKPKLN
ncbi:transglutaminase-like domain-containing protein [Parvibaculum sp.]|uniref:SirB1 family protein n=2 Tax=Parvibaculum sp. TaxID=2024848 RepID=UPI001B213316|nr:transglutaminase-like domain-containing protein [Parvibaculum sp.]MBO6677521.1 transglutaminase family protein [Parvibaculum sp.]MBO6685881.1 transglutaminase family protein [Parvibaculum sp.]MBO6905244.1 transglutaminase family protein [Parvibaculum sp.]